MNKKAVFEIGNIIHVERALTMKLLKRLTAEEITQTYEYKKFKEKYPEICKQVEKN